MLRTTLFLLAASGLFSTAGTAFAESIKTSDIENLVVPSALAAPIDPVVGTIIYRGDTNQLLLYTLDGWAVIASSAGKRNPRNCSAGLQSGTSGTYLSIYNSGTKVRCLSCSGLGIISSSDATYVSSASIGDYITINNSGLYSVVYNDVGHFSSAIGVSWNATLSDLSTAIQSLPATKRISFTSTTDGQPGVGTSTVTRLTAGDVLRPHTDGNAATGGGFPSYLLTFCVTRIGQ